MQSIGVLILVKVDAQNALAWLRSSLCTLSNKTAICKNVGVFYKLAIHMDEASLAILWVLEFYCCYTVYVMIMIELVFLNTSRKL